MDEIITGSRSAIFSLAGKHKNISSLAAEIRGPRPIALQAIRVIASRVIARRDCIYADTGGSSCKYQEILKFLNVSMLCNDGSSGASSSNHGI